MDFSEYQELASRTEKPLGTLQGRLIHAALGMITEGGEFVSEVKRFAIYEKDLTQEMHLHMAEEIGDALWYYALAANALGLSLEEIAKANIAKLRERFPDKYSNAEAEARADKGGLPHTQS